MQLKPRTVNPAVTESTMDLESEIGTLLDDLSSIQSELLGVLTEKRDALITADIVQLTALQPREEQLASRLSECQERRTSLLAEAKRQQRPGETLAKLVKTTAAGKSSNLGSRVKET